MLGLFGTKRKSMTMREAKEALTNDSSILLLDVRTPQEYREGHLPGSINFPLGCLPYAENVLSDKHAAIFVYCLSGARSQGVCGILLKMGYTNVTNIGGISSWNGELVRD